MLLLFDIDGTLLTGASETLRHAMNTALRQHHGVDAATMRRPFATAGRTDSEIMRAILLDLGIASEQIDELADDVRASCYETCARLYPDDLSDAVLPGVRELLEWLSGLQDVKLALLTGNFEPVARLKLARAGIGEFFAARQGGFGSDAEDRTTLPAIARRRAGTIEAPYPREKTIVIGDTPLDIDCARADDLRCIAVATGPYTTDELRGADAVVHDALELRVCLGEAGGLRSYLRPAAKRPFVRAPHTG
ncbi:MAG: HAD family hydrolase [Solirubrobacteraceae bacterium]